MWKCGACGYVWEDDKAPEKCPKCNAPQSKYILLEDKAAALIADARYSNALHMQLYGLLDQVMAIAEEGIDENLDPGCVTIFEQAGGLAELLQQSIKAEIETHVKKGKWG